MKIGVIILAAGESSRLGQPKQLLDFSGKTFLQMTIDAALSFGEFPVVVVLGARAVQIRETLDSTKIILSENTDWQQGMGSSIRVGLSKLLSIGPDSSAAVFLVCDQPFLTSSTIEKLVVMHAKSPSLIIASEYNGVLGVPALFDRHLFPELLTIAGSEGARKIILKYRAETAVVPFAAGSVDIDTPQDYLRLSETLFAQPLSEISTPLA